MSPHYKRNGIGSWRASAPHLLAKLCPFQNICQAIHSCCSPSSGRWSRQLLSDCPEVSESFRLSCKPVSRDTRLCPYSSVSCLFQIPKQLYKLLWKGLSIVNFIKTFKQSDVHSSLSGSFPLMRYELLVNLRWVDLAENN